MLSVVVSKSVFATFIFSFKRKLGVAIGLLLEEGNLSLDDKIVDHFPEKIDGEILKYHKDLTIREMLTMSTAGGPSKAWFTAGDLDRTHLYFNDQRFTHPSGTLWAYDKGDEAWVIFSKTAEYFLTEYQGGIIAKKA